ncbi:MAG: hypothetical protein WBW73_08265 [Rhodoplanes sp.]
MLIMDSPGRLVRARRDRDRIGSGGKRTPDTEADIVVPVVGGVPVAVGGAEVLWIVVPGTAANDTPTRGRPGFKGVGRIEPAPEDRMAQGPRICAFEPSTIKSRSASVGGQMMRRRKSDFRIAWSIAGK